MKIYQNKKKKKTKKKERKRNVFLPGITHTIDQPFCRQLQRHNAIKRFTNTNITKRGNFFFAKPQLHRAIEDCCLTNAMCIARDFRYAGRANCHCKQLDLNCIGVFAKSAQHTRLKFLAITIAVYLAEKYIFF